MPYVLKLMKSCWLLWQPSYSTQSTNLCFALLKIKANGFTRYFHCLKILSKTWKLTASLSGFKTDTICLVILPVCFFFSGNHSIPQWHAFLSSSNSPGKGTFWPLCSVQRLLLIYFSVSRCNHVASDSWPWWSGKWLYTSFFT